MSQLFITIKEKIKGMWIVNSIAIVCIQVKKSKSNLIRIIHTQLLFISLIIILIESSPKQVCKNLSFHQNRFLSSFLKRKNKNKTKQGRRKAARFISENLNSVKGKRMDDKELEFGADLDSSQICEKWSPSVLQNQNGRSQGELLLQKKKKKKLKKLASIKLSKSPSLKPSRKRSSSISNHHVSSTGGSSDTSTENVQASLLNSWSLLFF